MAALLCHRLIQHHILFSKNPVVLTTRRITSLVVAPGSAVSVFALATSSLGLWLTWETTAQIAAGALDRR
jgi:hypothetical protein